MHFYKYKELKKVGEISLKINYRVCKILGVICFIILKREKKKSRELGSLGSQQDYNSQLSMGKFFSKPKNMLNN